MRNLLTYEWQIWTALEDMFLFPGIISQLHFDDVDAMLCGCFWE